MSIHNWLNGSLRFGAAGAAMFLAACSPDTSQPPAPPLPAVVKFSVPNPDVAKWFIGEDGNLRPVVIKAIQDIAYNCLTFGNDSRSCGVLKERVIHFDAADPQNMKFLTFEFGVSDVRAAGLVINQNFVVNPKVLDAVLQGVHACLNDDGCTEDVGQPYHYVTLDGVPITAPQLKHYPTRSSEKHFVAFSVQDPVFAAKLFDDKGELRPRVLEAFQVLQKECLGNTVCSRYMHFASISSHAPMELLTVEISDPDAARRLFVDGKLNPKIKERLHDWATSCVKEEICTTTSSNLLDSSVHVVVPLDVAAALPATATPMAKASPEATPR